MLGYGPVYDYGRGKVDWLAAGLATEQTGSREQRALDVIQTAVTGKPTTTVRDLAEAARVAGADNVLIVDDGGCLVGRVKLTGGTYDPDSRAEDVMEPGPPTVRANEPLNALLERMEAKNVPEMIVTTPEAHVLGVVRQAR